MTPEDYAHALSLLVTGTVVAGITASIGRRRAANDRAVAAGHPCGIPSLSWPQRLMVAADIADTLAGGGLLCTRRRGSVVVRARGMDGDYVISVTRHDVAASYQTNEASRLLGRFSSASTAVRVVAGHAGLPVPLG